MATVTLRKLGGSVVMTVPRKILGLIHLDAGAHRGIKGSDPFYFSFTFLLYSFNFLLFFTSYSACHDGRNPPINPMSPQFPP